MIESYAHFGGACRQHFTYTLALHVYGVLTDRDWVRGLLLLDTFTSINSYIRYLYIRPEEAGLV